MLIPMEFSVKVRRGGVGTHFVIHRHFFDRSPHWKAIREEENQAESSHRKVAPDSTTDIYEEEERTADAHSLDFTPIDARHLSSLPLIRGRVVKLLKASKNQMHASNNMLITLVREQLTVYVSYTSLVTKRALPTRLRQTVASSRVGFVR